MLLLAAQSEPKASELKFCALFDFSVRLRSNRPVSGENNSNLSISPHVLLAHTQADDKGLTCLRGIQRVLEQLESRVNSGWPSRPTTICDTTGRRVDGRISLFGQGDVEQGLETSGPRTMFHSKKSH